MIQRKICLNKELFSTEITQLSSRDGFGQALLHLGKINKKVVVVSADLAESTRAHWFKEKYPERFVEVGVAEQNLASVAAGMAVMGKVPFICSFASFSPYRNWEQIRTTIAYNHWGSKKKRAVNVKIASSHAGVSTGPDGATHQALEDIALMRVLPGMNVIVPCDAIECEKATLAAADYPGPIYLRFSRPKSAVVTSKKTPFKIGRIEEFRSGKDCTIIANGLLVYEALKAAEKLKGEISCQVLNCHTVKPLDVKKLRESAKKTKCIVTAEEHQVAGGLGSAVAECLSSNFPVPIVKVGVKDAFGESGSFEELFKHFQLTSEDIVKAVRVAHQMKKKKK